MPGELSDYAEEASLADRVRTLCKRDISYITILRNIIEVNESSKGNQFGWDFYSLTWTYGHVNHLMKNKIIEYGYKSNTRTNYWLAVSGEELTKVLDEIERERKGAEQKHIESERQKIKDTTIPPDVIERFVSLIADGTDMLEYWYKWINPKIEGLDHVKKAILLSIASHGDKFGDRGRVHVLMHGEPGSAKSALKDWVVYQLGAESCSQRTTKVGLTGCASGEEITPGALARANGQVLCIDELDKFSKEDRQSLLEAMEEGIVLIEAGGMSARFDSETRIIACANKTEMFSPELMDRFDFKIEMKTPSPESEKKIICTVLDHWFETKEGYDGRDLKAYINWIKGFEPMIPLEVREKAKLLISMFIDLEESIRGSVRRKESLLRVAFTIAKLNKRNVETKDILSAIKIMYPTLNGGKMQALEQLAGMR